MPIRHFDGDTFLAFTDISGFKKMVEQPDRAAMALHNFFQTAYELLDENTGLPSPTVEGVLISDCGVIFVRPRHATPLECLDRLLVTIRELNRRLLPHRLMLSTSIGYGHFKYQDRFSFDGITKNALFGKAYLRAYLDTQSKRPKLECGYCRIVRDGLPEEVSAALSLENPLPPFDLVRRHGRHHFNYYWMRSSRAEIDDFERAYRNADNIRFEGIRHILEGVAP